MQRVEVGEIHEPDGAAPDLVLVGRADAALRRADLRPGAAAFAQRVELAVDREDERRVVGDAQVRAVDRDALPAQALDLGDERVRIEHDAVADDRELARAHDARRQERELVGLAADDERVAGVVAALEAHDDVGLLGQPVDDLALALVAPLGANDHDVRHADPSREKPRREAGAFGEPCRLSSAMVAARSRRASPARTRLWPRGLSARGFPSGVRASASRGEREAWPVLSSERTCARG